MKTISIIACMMFGLSLFQMIISADQISSKSPKYKADERRAVYSLGVKLRKGATLIKDCKGRPVGKKASSLSPRKGSDSMPNVKGLPANVALAVIHDALDEFYSGDDSDTESFNGFYPEE